MDDKRLTEQLAFLVELDRMKTIERQSPIYAGGRRENDAEHSWHIAVMAMVLREYAAEPVDMGHVLEMLTVHDLIEIYAGDTFAYDAAGNSDKAAREAASADRLYAMLPEEQGAYYRALWEEFDAMQTADSKYANCMDRIQPFLHNTLTGGHTWIQAGAKRSMVEKRMEIVRDFMPDVWKWAELNIQNGIKEGWITDCQTA